MLEGFDPQLLLVLDLAGTFAFGVSGALAGVRPIALRDWRYLAAVGVAALVVIVAHRGLERTRRWIDVMDAAGLSLFCVTGAVGALDRGFGRRGGR